MRASQSQENGDARRARGEGFIEPERIREWTEGSARGVFLSHFAPRSHELGEEHRSWLLRFASRLGSLTGNLYIVGLTHRGATEEDSRAVGDRRAREVYRFLRSRAHGFPWVDVHVGSTGDAVAGSRAERVARDRAVAVVHVAPGWVPVRWLREMVQSGPQPTSIFYVRAIRLGPPAAEGAPERVAGGEGESVAEASTARARWELEIGDGRWSVRYRAFGEGPPPSPEVPTPTVLVEGPWHTFTSAFDLRVDEFGGSAVRLSRSVRAGHERLGLRIARPPVSVAPFFSGAASSGRTPFDPSGRTPPSVPDPAPPGAGDPDTAVGRLDAAGRRARPHPIPAEIRAHLRRGTAAGPRTREGDLLPA